MPQWFIKNITFNDSFTLNAYSGKLFKTQEGCLGMPNIIWISCCGYSKLECLLLGTFTFPWNWYTGSFHTHEYQIVIPRLWLANDKRLQPNRHLHTGEACLLEESLVKLSRGESLSLDEQAMLSERRDVSKSLRWSSFPKAFSSLYGILVAVNKEVQHINGLNREESSGYKILL